MMRRSAVAYFLLLFLPSFLLPQTYIIRFAGERPDTAAVRNVLTAAARRSIALRSLPSAPFRSLSDRPSSSTFDWNSYRLVTLNGAGNDVLSSIAALLSVRYIEPIVLYRVNSIPNDSAYSSQWNLKRIGAAALWESGAVSANGPSVKVGVIDTGIDEAHPDLAGAIAINPGESGGGKETNGIDDDGNGYVDDWRGYDFVDGDAGSPGDATVRDNDPQDENGHGTAVSGIIGAVTNNGIGIAGISPARILPLRAFGKDGTGSDLDIGSALIYAADNGADVVNMSFGDVIQSAFLHDAVAYAASKNVVLVSSSGNDGSDLPHYPSDFSEVISTGSVSRFDSRSLFSSRSPSLDLMAPGEEIVTTTLGGGYTDNFAGTSAASPHVAAAAALIVRQRRAQQITNGSLPSLSPEEIRGILMNSADDVGDPGWDSYYGSGILNAAKALTAAAGTRVTIVSPELDEILPSGPIPIVATALSPYLQHVRLYYGAGDSPSSWTEIADLGAVNRVKDTLTVWNTAALQDGIYNLRLVVSMSKGSDVEFRQRVLRIASAPKVLSFRYRDSVLVGDVYAGLVEARIDRPSEGTLFYRKKGESLFKNIPSNGLQMNHSFLLSGKDFQPLVEYEFYCSFHEHGGVQRSVHFPTNTGQGFDRFAFTAGNRSVPSTGFEGRSFSFPAGYLLNAIVPVAGTNHLIMNRYDAEGAFGKLFSQKFSGLNFLGADSTARSWVPRSFQRTPNGSVLTLMQDRGISRLMQYDSTAGRLFQTTVWGDSSDVWASQLYDLDGDGLLEIVARSSTEYLIYKNNGGNSFTVAAHLPNPTKPMPGEAQNQFGPPRSLIGDFTGSGRKEIVFADDDGDLIMYRQSSANSLSFTLAGVDTTDLVGTSDMLAMGDFNGDGRLDIAIAGHNDRGWNQDREYNVPVWNVRVFSHRAGDAAGSLTKIWEQDIVGVSEGNNADNGLGAGRLIAADDRDALFLSLTPSLYVFRWDASSSTFVAQWIHASHSNAVIVGDIDNDGVNEFGFNTGSRTEFWSPLPSGSVAAPYALMAVPLTATSVRLQWQSTASQHRIFRGTHPDSLSEIAVVNASSAVDSSLIALRQYYYRVIAENGGNSQPSAFVSVTPHPAMVPLAADVVSQNQIAVTLNWDMTAEGAASSLFRLENGSRSSSVVLAASRRVIVTFPSAVAIGAHSISIVQASDASGMPADTTATAAFVISSVPTEEFIVRSCSLQGNDAILLQFSGTPDPVTSRMTTNYSVRTNARSFSVASVDSAGPTSVILHCAGNLTELSLRLEVRVDAAVRDLKNEAVNSGKGQVLSIAQTADDLDRIVVYPNPVRSSARVSFVNLPVNCAVTIYAPDGRKVKVIEGHSDREGIMWDLRDGNGNLVSTGIYLYRVERFNAANDVSATIMGKFAVIR